MSIKWGTLKTAEQIEQEEAIANFKSNRQSQLDSAIVTISTGKSFDADEKSITRLHNAITYIERHNATSIPWSTADVGSGVMVNCTSEEIIEAHRLSVENMTALWTLEEATE